VFVQFGIVLLEPRNGWIPWVRSIIDPSDECSQSRVVVERPQLFGNLNQLLDLLRSVFGLVVAQNQGNDPGIILSSGDNVVINRNAPIRQMFAHSIETCDRISLRILLPRNQHMLQPVPRLGMNGV
jgi:hypothetical protein